MGCGAKKEAKEEAKGTEEGTETKGEAQEKAEKKTFKVAMVLPGPISDAGWNANAYKGLMEARDKYGIEVAYSENVHLSDFEETFRDYASKGYDLIIGNGYEFGEVNAKVAPEFPNTWFVAINGDNFGPNYGSLQYKHWEVGYVAGALAGRMTKSGTIGFVGGMEIPSVSEPAAQYERAAKAFNPQIKVLTSYVGSWEDVAKGKELALALINAGADVLFHEADAAGTGVIQAADERGVWAIGACGDQSVIAPKVVLTSLLQESPKLIDFIVNALIEGKIEGKVYVLGLVDGVQGLAPYHEAVPEDVRKAVDQVVEDIKAGKITKQ